MKKISILIILFTLGCGSDITIDSDGVDFTDEEKCSAAGEERCSKKEIQVCFGEYWGTIVDCSQYDGGVCCITDAGPDCCE